MGDYSFSIDLPVRSEWANVDLVRTSVQSCLAAMFRDVDGCHAIAMVTGELLENAVKYGRWSGEERAFRLRVEGNARRAQVTVESPTAAADEHTADLLSTLEWIRTFPSAEAAYRARLLELGTSQHAASKLGLVRVAYEGECELSAEVKDGSVRVTADLEFPGD